MKFYGIDIQKNKIYTSQINTTDKYHWNVKINWFMIIILIIFNKRFRSCLTGLKGCILYALNNYEDKRGFGASDVLLFESNFAGKILKK